MDANIVQAGKLLEPSSTVSLSLGGKTEQIIVGSTVEPNRLRFDFTYGKQLTSQQLKDIEDWVNKAAQSGLATSVKVNIVFFRHAFLSNSMSST